MPYEVTKTVNGREYRYRVERRADPQTGKTKARWTYLGRAGGAEPRKRERAAVTRDRLVDALVELVEIMPWPEITVDVIAQRAGVAHGTLYRHFADRWAVLRAAIGRWRADLERERPNFDGPARSFEEERARMFSWIQTATSLKVRHPGLVRAYAALCESCEADNRERQERRAAAEIVLSNYLVKLSDAGLIARPADPLRLTRALFLALDSVHRGSDTPDAESRVEAARGIVELFDRAVFVPQTA